MGLEQHQSLCSTPPIQLSDRVSGFLPLVASLKGKSNQIQPRPYFIRPSEMCYGREPFLSAEMQTGRSESSDARTARALLLLFTAVCSQYCPSETSPHSTSVYNFWVYEDVLREKENSSHF